MNCLSPQALKCFITSLADETMFMVYEVSEYPRWHQRGSMFRAQSGGSLPHGRLLMVVVEVNKYYVKNLDILILVCGTVDFAELQRPHTGTKYSAWRSN